MDPPAGPTRYSPSVLARSVRLIVQRGRTNKQATAARNSKASRCGAVTRTGFVPCAKAIGRRPPHQSHRNCGSKMRRPRAFFLALAVWCLMLGKARAQYAYVTHSNVLVNQRATTIVLPANPLRAFVYCVIASPARGEALAPSVVTMGDATTGVAVHYPDRPPQLWGSTGMVWVFSDQTALISCTELAIPPYRTPLHGGTN
jgi:hypothetical protein